MKHLLFLPLILLSICQARPAEGEDRHCEVVGEIINTAAHRLSETYGLQCVGSGGEAMVKIRCIELAFNTDKIRSKEEGRALLVDLVQDFIEIARAHPELSEYLDGPVFDEKNVEVVVAVYLSDGEGAYYPEISTFVASRGVLRYMTQERDKPFSYTAVGSESYEEACALLEEERAVV